MKTSIQSLISLVACLFITLSSTTQVIPNVPFTGPTGTGNVPTGWANIDGSADFESIPTVPIWWSWTPDPGVLAGLPPSVDRIVHTHCLDHWGPSVIGGEAFGITVPGLTPGETYSFNTFTGGSHYSGPETPGDVWSAMWAGETLADVIAMGDSPTQIGRDVEAAPDWVEETWTFTATSTSMYIVLGCASDAYRTYAHKGVLWAMIDPDLVTDDPACDDLVIDVPVTELCFGDELTLDATSVNGGIITWDMGVENGVAFTPPAGVTTYSATSDMDADCPYSIEITVHELPDVIANTSDDEICIGDMVTLTGEGADAYVWDMGVTDGEPFAPIDEGMNTYTVTGTDGNGCENTATVDVNVLPLPMIDAGEDVGVCDGDEVTLTGSGAGPGGTYDWDGGVVDGEAFTPLATTVYTVTGTTTEGCVNTDDMTVTVNALPVIDAGEDVEICEGDMVTLTGAGAGPGGDYVWDGGVVDGVAFGPDATTVYTVTGTDANGCENTDDLTVTVLPPPAISGGEDIAICEGEEVTLTGSGAGVGGSYVWDGGVVDGEAFTPAATATYTVTGTNDIGCSNTATVTVTVVPFPGIDAGADQEICLGDAVTLSGSGAGPGGVYDWDGGVVDGTPFTPAATFTYTVSGSTAEGCASEDMVTVTVNPLPNVSFTGDELMGCVSHTVNFSTLTPGASYEWNFGDGGTATTSLVSHEYTSTGLFDVTLTVTSADGCVGSATYNDYIQVVPTPIASFTYAPTEIDINNTRVQFTNNSLYATTYTWDFGDGSANSSVENPAHDFPAIGNMEYMVTLTAENSHGCSDQIQQIIVVKDVLNYFMPNTFTPDGDLFNEEFTPVFDSGLDIYDFHLMIFNRWGEMVFESFNAAEGWNGSYGDNGLVEDGVYIWRMEFGETMSDKKHKVHGHVTVIK